MVLMLSIEEKSEIVTLARKYSSKKTAEIFNRRYPNRPSPLHRRTVERIFANLRDRGSLERRARVPSIQKRLENQQNRAEIVEFFKQNKHSSTRKAAVQLGSRFIKKFR